MIDIITMIKTNTPENEVSQIVERAKLQECTRNGKLYYETSLQQRNKEHIFIRIEANGKLKIECSLHKLHEQKTTGHYTNYGIFTLEQAKTIVAETLQSKGISPDGIEIYGYEIGVNLLVSDDCRAYLDRMETIGVLTERKPFLVNPRYKDYRVKTTFFHRHIRKHFKAYDKGFEARDKRRNDVPDQNILRIETVYRRVENMPYDEFFSPANLKKMRDRFFRDWRTLQFYKEVHAPKGTGQMKKSICKSILEVGAEKVLIQARERHKTGAVSDRELRTIREFIVNEWNTIKKEVQLIQTPQEIEYRELLNNARILLLE